MTSGARCVTRTPFPGLYRRGAGSRGSPGGPPGRLEAEMPELRALFLNCTLKRSPSVSHTEGLARKVIQWFDKMRLC